MPNSYEPPCSISPSILRLVAEISERVGRATSAVDRETELRLRRINRIRTIQGTLAIEGNKLTPEQITAVLEGKRVLAPQKDIQEARNALQAYELFTNWAPDREADLLQAHHVLMRSLLDRPGAYRTGGVGVMAGDSVVHMAPPADRVPVLMKQLLDWVARTDQHPLLVSSIFHYELEFIHPFEDGNGRIGRLWQTLILSRWRSVFGFLPVETMVHGNQEDYYGALQTSNAAGDSASFVEFMLQMVLATLEELDTTGSTEQVTEQATEQVARLLIALADEPRSTKALMERLGLAHRPTFLYDYLRPAIDAGLVEMTDPDHPKSPRQKYRLTETGRRLRTKLDQG
jgi:Fic family protein